MANQLTVGTIMVTRAWSVLGGQASVQRLYWLVNSVGAPPITDDDVAQAVDAPFAAFLIPHMANAAEYRGIQAQVFRPQGLVATQYAGSAGNGTGGTGQVPSQCRGLISWKTIKAGHAFRGRMYMPFAPLNDITGTNTFTAGYLADLSTLRLALQNLPPIAIGGRTGTLQLILYHLKAGKNGVPPANSTDNIVDGRATVEIATQRRSGDFGRLNASPI